MPELMTEKMTDQKLERQRPTWAQISLPALKHNYQTIRNHLIPNTQLMAVVKADAYGHGAVECARALESINTDWFGVALVEEGVELRRAGISRPILCLGGFWRGHADEVISNNLIAVVHRLDQIEELNERARALGRSAGYHLEIDTGMGRLGIRMDELKEFARSLRQFDFVKLDGVMTHFASADSDVEFTELQIANYESAIEILREIGLQPSWRHLANSAGIHAYPQSHRDLARVGGAMYGLTRDVLSPKLKPFDLRPVMSLHSRIMMLKTVPAGTPLGYGLTFTTSRESRIATIPIGYADGLRRSHSNSGRVLIDGAFAKIVGRVSMDLTIIDVTDIPGVETGAEVILIGEQDGKRISAEDAAEQIGTISYEIVTGISARVPRVYVNS